MDELVGMESDWIKTAEASSTTAYGYVQFTEASVQTAINRYINHLERFNTRSLTRDWVPYSIKLGETLPIPEWLETIKYSTKTHKEKLNTLTYDEILALAFVHLHSGKSKDSNFVLLAKGDIYAAKEIYKNNHHTNPDEATLARLKGFFPWRKQNKYVEKLAASVSSVPAISWIYKSCAGDLLNQVNGPENVINKLREKLIMHNGEDLFLAYQNEPNVTVTDVTPSIAANLGVYAKYNVNLTNQLKEDTSQYKVFKRKQINTNEHGFYFYRTGDLVTEWLQNVKDELTNNNYNYDELCQTIESWPFRVHTYIVDWFKDTIDVNYVTPPTIPSTDIVTAGFFWPNKKVQPTGIIAIGLAIGNIREQLNTLFHEGGGHAIHRLALGGWGGKYGDISGDKILLNSKQIDALSTVYKNYSNIQDPLIATLLKDFKDAEIVMLAARDKKNISWDIYFKSGLDSDLNQFKIDKANYKIAYDAHLIPYRLYRNYYDKVYAFLPMNDIKNLGASSYNPTNTEEEFLSRVYSLMVMNKCITFVDDIWPIMKKVSPSIAVIIDINLAKVIDIVMRDEMKLDRRTYNI
jgi:hypothetical protein